MPTRHTSRSGAVLLKTLKHLWTATHSAAAAKSVFLLHFHVLFQVAAL